MKTYLKKIPWLPLFLAGLLTGNEARAQNPFPYVPLPTDSAVWYVFEGARYFKNVPNGNEPGGPPVRIFGPFLYGYTVRYTINGDTLAANGKTYNIINVTGVAPGVTNRYYLRQDSVERRVYWRHDLYEFGPEFLLYEFNKSVGDTVRGSSIVGKNIIAVVDSVKYLTMEGVQHKALYLRNVEDTGRRFFDVWIEGIGSIYGLLFAYSSRNLILPGGPLDGELQCLTTRDGTLFTGEYVSVCGDTMITGIEEAIARARWGIAPNPVEDRITQANWPVREDQITSFELLDANGSVLSIEKMFTSESITNLTQGVYCLRLNVKNEIPFIQRFIKL